MFPSLLWAEKTIEGVTVASLKKDKGRLISAKASKIFELDIKTVSKKVIDFENKCNNDLRRKRKLISKESNCLYPNKNVIEAVKLPSLKPNCKKCFLIFRRISNRSYFQHYDLIESSSSGISTIINHRMLSNEKLSEYITQPKKTRSAFKSLSGQFKLTKLEDKKTKVEYFYKAYTENWLLNLEITQNTLLENVANGVRATIDAIGIVHE